MWTIHGKIHGVIQAEGGAQTRIVVDSCDEVSKLGWSEEEVNMLKFYLDLSLQTFLMIIQYHTNFLSNFFNILGFHEYVTEF